MTQSIKDIVMRVISRPATDGESSRSVSIVLTAVAAMMLLAAPSAFARVELKNAVEKVETFVNADGVAESRLVAADSVVPGDELRYTITFVNTGQQPVDERSIVITNPIPQSTEYLDGSADGDATDILFSVDDGASYAKPAELVVVDSGVESTAAAKDYTTIRWTFGPELKPGEEGSVVFNVRLK